MINKESTKAGVIVMAMILAMYALAGILAKGCERIDATWEEQYPTEVREVAARGVREIPAWTSLGIFKITNYCTCKECNGPWVGYPTKLGTEYVEGRTIGVDTSIIPLGSEVLIDGHIYIAEDTGSFTGKIIDVYVTDHSKFDRKYLEVFIRNKED